jgi:hypothetical protein
MFPFPWRNGVPSKVQTGLAVTIICVVISIVAGRGITDEGMVSLQGDMPRFLMNGVFLQDLLRDFPITNFMQYAVEYYSRYPALSLGHHPPLLSLAEVPFFFLFGHSVFAGKLTILFFFLLAGVSWFLFVALFYERYIAFLSTLLFITTPFIVSYSRVVLSELPALSLIILTSYLFFRYLETENNKDAIAFAIAFVLSLYAKQLAVLMAPVFILSLVFNKGVRKLWDRQNLVLMIAIGVMTLPLIAMTVKFSPTNIAFASTAADNQLTQVSDGHWDSYPLPLLWNQHLFWPVALLGILFLCVSIWRREKQSYFFILWILAVYGLSALIGPYTPRFSIYWIPPFCLFASLIVTLVPHLWWRRIASGLVLLLVVSQGVIAYSWEAEGASGYEAAAQYVVQHGQGASVMFSGSVDTGYFVFFTKKHDLDHRMIILLADKIFATSKLGWVIEDRISDSKQIDQVLQDFGVCFVVLEDKPYKAQSLNWLREKVKTEKFVLRKTIPIQSTSRKLQGVSLTIYERKNCGPPNPNAMLKMNLPLVGRSIELRFGDLIQRSGS